MPELGRSYYTRLPKLRFPRDNPTDYKGVIEFRLVRIESPTVNLSTAQDLINNLLDDGTLRGGDDRMNSPSQNNQTLLPGRREYPSSFPNVTLYLPQAVQFTDGMEYDNNVQLGILGASGEAAINAGGGLGEAITNMVNAGTSSFTDLFRELPSQDLARLALARATTLLPVGSQLAGDVASAALRTTINPNRRTLFRGVRPREFTFVFKMVANSAAEAQEIEDIITFFRREMYPTSIDVRGISAGYKYPNPFLIDLKYGSARVGTRLLNCYLQNIQTTYNQSSMGFHADGKPSEVDFLLTFLEERALDRGDIERGF